LLGRWQKANIINTPTNNTIVRHSIAKDVEGSFVNDERGISNVSLPEATLDETTPDDTGSNEADSFVINLSAATTFAAASSDFTLDAADFSNYNMVMTK
jgi:hypothetical protein